MVIEITTVKSSIRHETATWPTYELMLTDLTAGHRISLLVIVLAARRRT